MTDLFVVPCGRAKLACTAPARILYQGDHFTYALAKVEAHALATGGTVRILSARHGLLDPEQDVDPYDTTMRDHDSITARALAHQIATHGPAPLTVHAFLPAAYLHRLLAAAMHPEQPLAVRVVNHFADAPGIGYQRQVLANL